VSIQAGYHLAI